MAGTFKRIARPPSDFAYTEAGLHTGDLTVALLTASRRYRNVEARRLRKLERLLFELNEKLSEESDRLRASFDSIAATAAFAIEAIENGDTNPRLATQVDALGASLVWHSNRLSSLKEQREFVAMTMGALKPLIVKMPGPPKREKWLRPKADA